LKHAGALSSAGAVRLRAAGALWAAALAATAVAVVLVPRSEGLLGLEGGPGLALGRVLAAAAAAMFAALAWGLWRGKRRALQVMVGVLVVGAALGAVDGASPIATAAELASAATLFASRRAFERGGTALGARRAGLALALVALSSYALAAAPVLEGRGAPGPWAGLSRTGAWLANGSWWLRSGSPLAIALDALLVVGLVGAAVLLRSLLSPTQAQEGHTPTEHARAAAIVRNHARDSLDPFALREDKSFHFAHGGMLAYRVVRETAVVAGDPVGPPGCAPAVLADFQRVAAGRGWEVVVTGASDRYLAAYRALGYRTVRIGNEAIVEPPAFSLEGRAVRKVRQSLSRVVRHGWTVDTVEARQLTEPVIEELGAVDRAWSDSQPRLCGFAMTLGRLWGAEEDDEGVYVLARDANGELRSFLRFARYREGLSLDVMRRSGCEPNGVNEALVVAALEYARDRGLREVSLNFAGFAHVMADGARLTGTQRLLRRLLRAGHGRFQLERLVSFNDKFFPEWRARYLVHEGGPGLPLGGLRVLQAEAYLRRPRANPVMGRWHPLPLPVRFASTPSPTRLLVE
jgi:lysyl-tRNA synthetase, class II